MARKGCFWCNYKGCANCRDEPDDGGREQYPAPDRPPNNSVILWLLGGGK